MEPLTSKMRIYLGEFEVVQVKFDGVTVNIGKNVHITLHVGDFKHTTKPGDKIPFFTELEYADTRQPSE